MKKGQKVNFEISLDFLDFLEYVHNFENNIVIYLIVKICSSYFVCVIWVKWKQNLKKVHLCIVAV